MHPTLRIATRKSPLALWQSEHVAARLRAAHPGLEVVLVPMSTRGDEVLDRSLAAIGGKGLFLKELELAMLRGEADCAVHSLKDVPMELEPGFALPAILERADHADAFVSNRYDDIAALPQGARVGTSSLRRQAQLRALRPDLQLRDLRGNVNTRLAKLDAGEYDAIVLACAGLQRLGFDARIRSRMDAPQWLPAPAQGAIAIECRDDDAAIARAVRRARSRRHAHLRGGRARDEPRAARQLPRAGRRVRVARRRAPATAWSGRIGRRWSRGARARRRDAAMRPNASGWKSRRKLLAQGADALLRDAVD